MYWKKKLPKQLGREVCTFSPFGNSSCCCLVLTWSCIFEALKQVTGMDAMIFSTELKKEVNRVKISELRITSYAEFHKFGSEAKS